jgi:hypothetical protein
MVTRVYQEEYQHLYYVGNCTSQYISQYLHLTHYQARK